MTDDRRPSPQPSVPSGPTTALSSRVGFRSPTPSSQRGLPYAIGTALAGVGHAVLVAVDPEKTTPAVEPAPTEEHQSSTPQLTYSPAGELVSKHPFVGETHPDEITQRLIGLWQRVFAGPPGTNYYYDLDGKLLMSNKANKQVEKLRKEMAEVVKNIEEEKDTRKKAQLKARLEQIKEDLVEATQIMHNTNRETISNALEISNLPIFPKDPDQVGYPFVAVSPSDPIDIENSLLDGVHERLNEKVKTEGTPSYFDGQELTLYEGIERIAAAYEIPRAIAFGIGAQESTYHRELVSKANAKGIYQLTEGGYEKGLIYANRHPEFSSTFREGALPPFETGWKNRLVSTEIFCAHYRALRDELKDPVDKLEEELRKTDPEYLSETLLPLACINAYNAGAQRIIDCINRFLGLSETERKQKLGRPPYGSDAWLNILSISYGAKKGNKSTGVGSHVFAYPYKALAMGSLIMDEENALSVPRRFREKGERDTGIAGEDEAEESGETREWGEAIANHEGKLKLGTALVAGLGVAATANNLRRNPPSFSTPEQTHEWTRREVVQATLAALGVGAPVLAYATKAYPGREKDPDELHQSTYPEVVLAAQQELDVLYVNLPNQKIRALERWTADEDSEFIRYKMPAQRALLEEELKELLGEDLMEEFDKPKHYESPEAIIDARRKRFAEGSRRQAAYIEKLKEEGKLIPLKENDRDAPYFCEQVGRNAGIENNPDALWIRPEFLPILGSLVELVNYQIDKFNDNPTLFGAPRGSQLMPPISAFKISGALRSSSQSLARLEGGQAESTTEGPSAHWSANALDISSYTTPGGHMVRLAQPLRDREGNILVKAGWKLPNHAPKGDESHIREILFLMVGRALFAMKSTLRKKENIELLPYYERIQKNWHIVAKKLEG